jgi:hypothetical protein
MKANKMPERRKGTPRAWVMRQMRLPLILASVFGSMAHAGAAEGPSAKPSIDSRKMGLDIKIEGGGWGSANPETIERVLYSVADELMARLPNKLTTPIVVSHTDGNPVALYDRGVNGEYRVHLHATGQSWHLYVYEFAHELCHILSNYEENVGTDTTKYNQWFEETLCETASLFALKSLAETWDTSPASPEIVGRGKSLRRFFEHLIAEGHRQLPAYAPLASWLQENQDDLRNNPYLRDKNDVVANLLLPLFQSNPQNWDALTYLNLNPDDARSSLEDYLRHWYQNAPLEHKHFVASVLSLLWAGDGSPPSLADTRDSATLAAGLPMAKF